MTGNRYTAKGRTEDRDHMALHRALFTPMERSRDPLLVQIERSLAPVARWIRSQLAKRNEMSVESLREAIHKESRRAADRRARARINSNAEPLEMERPAIQAQDSDQSRPRAFSREPCPYCAVRGDHGCRHFAPFRPE